MRVKKDNIVNGIVSYVENEVIPKIGDRATQIIASVGANAIRSNTKLVDAIFDNGVVKVILDDDGSGTYETDGLFNAIQDSIEKYGNFPLQIPPIPIVSPTEKQLTFTSADIAEIRHRIERGA